MKRRDFLKSAAGYRGRQSDAAAGRRVASPSTGTPSHTPVCFRSGPNNLDIHGVGITVPSYKVSWNCFNVFPALKSGDFCCQSLTFQADTKNVACCVDVAIVRATTARTFPMPHLQTCDTFRAAECKTLRTGCRSQSFVNFDKTRLVPSGLVGKHVSQHRPSCVAYGFRHTRLGKFGGADIADDDDAVLPSNPRGFLVKLMSARVGDLGVDRLDALLAPGALGARKRGLVPAVVTKRWNARTIAARRKRLEPEIDADRPAAGWKIVRDLTLEADVPSPSRILDERASLELSFNLPRHPEAELAFEVDGHRAIHLQGRWDKRNPSKFAARTGTGPEPRASSLGIARRNELPANRLNRIGVQSKIGGGPRAQLDQVERGRPAGLHSRPPAPLRFSLDLAAIVPYIIHRARAD